MGTPGLGGVCRVEQEPSGICRTWVFSSGPERVHLWSSVTHSVPEHSSQLPVGSCVCRV